MVVVDSEYAFLVGSPRSILWIAKIEEEGRYLTDVAESGQQLPLRISNATDIEGVPDRSLLKVGMKFSALYEEQKERNETLQIKLEP